MMNKRGQEIVFPVFVLLGIFLVGFMVFAMHQFDTSFVAEQKEFDYLAMSLVFTREYVQTLVENSAVYASEQARGTDDFITTFRTAFSESVRTRNREIVDGEVIDSLLNTYELVAVGEGYELRVSGLRVSSTSGMHEVRQEISFSVPVSR